MPVPYDDGTTGEQNFGPVHQGDGVDLDIMLKDKLKANAEVFDDYSEMIWELEGVETKVTKTLSGGGIFKISDHLARVRLTSTDTANLLGAYTHQLRLITSSGSQKVATDGIGTFVKQVF